MSRVVFLLLALVAVCLSGCCHAGSIPESVRRFASELPARADGQYAVLDDLLRKQLVMKDAMLQYKIDLDDGKAEPDSAACNCAESASADWLGDCKPWLGSHVPIAAPVIESPAAAPTNS